MQNSIRCNNLSAIFAPLLLILLVCPPFAVDASESVEQQRKRFVALENEIKQGKQVDLDREKAALKNYPLLPYLDYAHLTTNLTTTNNDAVKAFLSVNDDTPLAKNLRYRWLKHLAQTQQDNVLIANMYQTSDAALDCDYRNALLRQGKEQLAYDGAQRLWLVSHSQPDNCDRFFQSWERSGGLTTELRWQRAILTLRKGEINLANHLAKALPTQRQEDFKLWSRVHNDPALVNSLESFSPANKTHAEILAYGVIRLAFKNLDAAIASWQSLQPRFAFSQDDRERVERTIALLIGQTHHDDALPLLNAVSPDVENQRVREWRVRAALREGDWPAALASIGWLSEEEQASTRWQYWRARALAALDFNQEANDIFETLATKREFFGFLSADRLNVPYSFANNPAQVDPKELHAITSLGGIRRAKELLALDRPIEARREWDSTSEKLSQAQLRVAAKLAESWQWHPVAITTAAKAAYWDDMPLRFPLGYETTVVRQAKLFNIEPAWVYGIMRQESGFAVDARSGKGALGLMQLLPSTGQHIAKRSKTPYTNSYDLLIADKNIQLGSAYLKDVRAQLYDNPILATAAYNAGHTRAKRWLPDSGTMDADIWIETIPYDETRDYLERVLSYTTIYDWRLNGKQQNTLKNFMKPIKAPVAN